MKLYSNMVSGKALITPLGFLLLSTPALAQDPLYMEPDDTFITLSGTVESVDPDRFELDYGQGSITVEMDDGDRDADSYDMLEGDNVSVSGYIDTDFYDETTLDASSVYVEDIDTYFFAADVDEQDRSYTLDYETPMDFASTNLQGVVSEVGTDDFTINTGDLSITIEMDAMSHDPLDDEGYQQIEEGDIVSVRGHVDIDLFENHTFEADSVTTLIESS